jgi:hypothetical protein
VLRHRPFRRNTVASSARASGDYAYVLLDTGSIEYPYLYGVDCQRRNGRWFDSSDGNSPGWARNRDSGVGTQSFWSQAPVGADMVRIEFDGTAIEEPVTNGAYLAVWWNVEVEEAFFHCSKCVVRSNLWTPAAWPALDGLPSLAQTMVDAAALPMPVEALQEIIKQDEAERLY